MDFIDYYDVMGVKPDASSDEIKRAYRKLARKYHPDVSKEADAETRFKALGEAWAVLKDTERRREYDELRTMHERGGFAGAAGGAQTPGWRGSARGTTGSAGGDHDWYGDTSDYSDFFRDLFGESVRRGGGAQSGYGGGFHERADTSLRGEDVHGTLSIRLQDAHDGASLPLTLRSPVRQPDGTIGFEEKTLQVRIPVGVTAGQRLRLRGQGAPGWNGGESGDLFVEIAIEPDERFTLDRRDVTLVLPVAPWEAALGTVLPVPTLGGEVRLTIPAHSSGGRRLRLKGRGLAAGSKDGTAGDQFVVLRIELPQPDNDEQRALYEQMRQLWPSFEPRAELGRTS